MTDGLHSLCEKLSQDGDEGACAPVVIHSGEGEEGAPHIVSAAFTGVRSEVLLHALEEKNIYVSAGSACSSNKKLPVSPVLKELASAPRAS